MLRNAYAPLYIRNEFAHELPDDALIGLIVEETGQPHDSNAVKLAYACFKHLKAFADFKPTAEASELVAKVPPEQPPPLRQGPPAPSQSVGLNLGYTINLNLPATSDPEVFDAIFRSLKQHLLRTDDG